VAAYALTPPSLQGSAGVQSFNQKAYALAQGAIFRRMDFVVEATTGTITTPDPNGSLASVVPTAVPTIALSTSAGAAGGVFSAYYTYTGSASIESQPSAGFYIVIPPGKAATVTVPSAGAPAAATDFSLYAGLIPGYEVLQVSGTALGSAADFPQPLTNYRGINRAASNANSQIVGLALDDFDCNFTNGTAYAQTNRSLFGADVTGPPAGFSEQYKAYVIKLQSPQQIEMSLIQAWYPSLAGSAIGITYSTEYDTFGADTGATAIGSIVGKAAGANNPNYDSQGGVGDTGARVVVQITSGLV
jgi:hypothetical protein